MNQKLVSIGIDISKHHLDVYINLTNQVRRFANNLSGLEELVKILPKASQVHRIVMEPSGGYEQLALTYLCQRQFPVSLVDAKRIRNFAKASGQLAKTDPLDAQVLAKYGDLFNPSLTLLSSEEEKKLAAFILRRGQVIEMLVAEKNRLEKNPFPEVEDFIRYSLETLQNTLSQIEKKIEDLLQEESLQPKSAILTQVVGIGSITSATLLSLLPELGKMNKKQICSLVGIAPFNADSGNKRGTRHIKGGRKQVRNALYMACIASLRHNPTIRTFYNHLIAQGKFPKVAIVACMRKLLITLNARMQNFLNLKPVY